MLESVRVAQNHRFSGIEPTTRRTYLIIWVGRALSPGSLACQAGRSSDAPLPAPAAAAGESGWLRRMFRCAKRLSGSKLTVENDQMNLGVGQLSNTDRIAPKHFGRNLSWIIAGTKNDDPGAGDLRQQTFEIAIRRDQDQVVSGSVVQHPRIAGTSQPVSERALGRGEKVAQ